MAAEHYTSVLGMSRIRKYPERARHARRTYLREFLTPVGFRVSAITALGAQLDWSNLEPDVTGLNTLVERRAPDLPGSDEWTTAADFTADNVDTALSGLLASTEYIVRVCHYDPNGKGRSAYAYQTFTTAA